MDYERSLCDGCRQIREQGRDRWRVWAVEKDDVCQGCRALAMVQRDLDHEAETTKNPLHNAGRRLYIASSRKIPNPLEA